MPQSSDFDRTTSAGFDNTAWTVVLDASGKDEAARAALEQLCQSYWPPIYSFLRRQGKSREDAKDLTQGFFAHLLNPDWDRLGKVDPANGKFRSFLLACLKNHLLNDWNRGHAIKRIPKEVLTHIPISEEETGYWEPVGNEADPSSEFDREWARRLNALVLKELAEEWRQIGKLRKFEVLSPFIIGDGEHGGYAEAAASLGTTEDAIRVAVHRLRERYRETLKAVVGRTVAYPSQIPDEIKHLVEVLRNS